MPIRADLIDNCQSKVRHSLCKKTVAVTNQTVQHGWCSRAARLSIAWIDWCTAYKTSCSADPCLSIQIDASFLNELHVGISKYLNNNINTWNQVFTSVNLEEAVTIKDLKEKMQIQSISPSFIEVSKFFIKDFSSKCDQIRRFLRIWLHLLKKSLMEKFIFCAVEYRWMFP